MENNYKLSVVSNSLKLIEDQLSIGNKILLKKDNKQEIIDFLIRFSIDEGEDNFNAFVFISNQYPLSLEMIEKYKDYLDFNHLSLNTQLQWFEGLIDLYLDSWNWKNLSFNTSLPWSNNFIQKYEDYFDWEILCSNENLPWNNKFIEKYMEKFFENYNDSILSSNNGLIWTEELIKLFDNGIPKVKERQILSNDAICWGIFNKNGEKQQPQDIFYKVNRKYHLKKIFEKDIFNDLDNADVCWSCVCRQIKKIDNDFLINNNYRIDWYELSENENCLTIEILENFKDKLSWDALSKNKSLPWSLEFIKKFENCWNWEYLSTSESIPWSQEIIDAFIDKWSWKSVMSLSSNPNLPISVDFINKYRNYIDLSELQFNNEGNFWTNEFINTFENEMESWMFSGNKSFPWSIEMIKRFKEYQCSHFIHPKVIDEILPILDDETVIHIFDTIINIYE